MKAHNIKLPEQKVIVNGVPLETAISRGVCAGLWRFLLSIVLLAAIGAVAIMLVLMLALNA